MPACLEPRNARLALREATREAHDRLHGLPLFQPLLEGEVTSAGYRTILETLYGFHQPIEAALCEADTTLSQSVMVERPRAQHLRTDLLDRGLSAGALAALPLASPPAGLGDPGRFLGALYVREGSTLGGRIMAKHLDHLCDPGRIDGRRFLSGTEDDSRLWRECCAALEEAADLGHLKAMVDAAHETFAMFEAWATQNVGRLRDGLEKSK